MSFSIWWIKKSAEGHVVPGEISRQLIETGTQSTGGASTHPPTTTAPRDPVKGHPKPLRKCRKGTVKKKVHGTAKCVRKPKPHKKAKKTKGS